MEFKGLEGEALRIAIDTFYLLRDPLAPAEQASLWRGILYVTEYRWFLGSNAVTHKDIAHYEVCRATTNTGCIEGFSGAENCIENAMKITNSISIFYPLKSVMDVKLFLLCHS